MKEVTEAEIEAIEPRVHLAHDAVTPTQTENPMSRLKTFVAVAIATVAMPLMACSEEAGAPAPEQVQQMEKVIRDYLVNNPEVIIEALDAYQAKQQAAQQANQKHAITAMADALRNGANDPVMGNPDGDVTVVEFFDYRCGFCKRVFDDVQTLIREDGNIRYVLKEFPILGPDSLTASRAAMAVWLHQRDKYEAFHTAMMKSRGELSEAKVMALGLESGVDIEALKLQMEDPQVLSTLRETAAQAEALNISGTPAFIIGDAIQPGAIPLDMMKELVDAARGNS